MIFHTWKYKSISNQDISDIFADNLALFNTKLVNLCLNVLGMCHIFLLKNTKYLGLSIIPSLINIIKNKHLNIISIKIISFNHTGNKIIGILIIIINLIFIPPKIAKGRSINIPKCM